MDGLYDGWHDSGCGCLIWILAMENRRGLSVWMLGMDAWLVWMLGMDAWYVCLG